MRYVTIGDRGRFAGKRTVSDITTISSLALKDSREPKVALSLSVFEDRGAGIGDDEVSDLTGIASVVLSASSARQFAQNLLKSADEAEERARRLRYVDEVKEVLS